MLARLDSDWSRKRPNALVLYWVVGCLRCPRKDSSPLLKAKEPRGNAESDSSSRACKEAGFAVSEDIVRLVTL